MRFVPALCQVQLSLRILWVYDMLWTQTISLSVITSQLESRQDRIADASW